MNSRERAERDTQIWRDTKSEIEGQKMFRTVIKPLIKKIKEKKKPGI